MAVLFQIGVSLPSELSSGIGHMAGTLGGVNYESRGGRGCLKGSAARGASNPLFRHHFHLLLTDAQAAEARRYANACVGRGYLMGGMPSATRRGDCSGYMAGIWCAAMGQRRRRLFWTGNFTRRRADLGFRPGLGAGVTGAHARCHPLSRADRPFPGFVVQRNSRPPGHIRWIQARLNCAANNRHTVLDGRALAVDGDFGSETNEVVRAFQRRHRLEVDGQVGRNTWRGLNAVR